MKQTLEMFECVVANVCRKFSKCGNQVCSNAVPKSLHAKGISQATGMLVTGSKAAPANMLASPNSAELTASKITGKSGCPDRRLNKPFRKSLAVTGMVQGVDMLAQLEAFIGLVVASWTRPSNVLACSASRQMLLHSDRNYLQYTTFACSFERRVIGTAIVVQAERIRSLQSSIYCLDEVYVFGVGVLIRSEHRRQYCCQTLTRACGTTASSTKFSTCCGYVAAYCAALYDPLCNC
jgi:hypothetical protein